MANKLHGEYPHLKFERNWVLTNSSQFFLGQCDAFVKAIRHTPIMPQHYKELMHVALVKGAQATTAIEGNTLTDDEIEKMLDGKKLPPSKEYQEIEVRNVIDALNQIKSDLIDNNNDRLVNGELLKRFNKLIGKDLGVHFDAKPGEFRNNNVVVGRYRCPDYLDVHILVDKFGNWLREEFNYEKKNQTFSEVVIQAIISHIYIEWIHPFGDGNGRTGRLVEFYILLRGGNPTIASHILSNHYNQTRNEYYRQIEMATVKRSLTEFIEYALQGFRDGLQQTLEIIQKSQFENTWQKYIYDTFGDVKMVKKDVFKRRRTLALEFPIERAVSLYEIPELSIKLARLYSKMSDRTLLRDLDELLKLKLIKKEDGKYFADTALINHMIPSRRSQM